MSRSNPRRAPTQSPRCTQQFAFVAGLCRPNHSQDQERFIHRGPHLPTGNQKDLTAEDNGDLSRIEMRSLDYPNRFGLVQAESKHGHPRHSPSRRRPKSRRDVGCSRNIISGAIRVQLPASVSRTALARVGRRGCSAGADAHAISCSGNTFFAL